MSLISTAGATCRSRCAAPPLLPVVKAVGVDPVHFGMITIMMINLGIGPITPPVGTVVCVGSAVAKPPIAQVVRALLPCFGLSLIVTCVPALSLWLPQPVGVWIFFRRPR